ncbi:ATP-binding protein [Actinomyces sp.]|uniref:ATP-binding protein n=1 Tax=Actinomyces sp. TaxID=29317 RepID=UPI0026DADA1F|nr:SbcC/MukB-like Walker B domain-containing protein [Actinomyces sp.]MDO4900953.1 ATP-binding protein [Actinomyces sp.]
MTMIDTLFGLIPAASRGQQWLAQELQLINWGGYDGYHRVRFSPTATLLCGGSGSGKSTLMDAYIALMMPHTTPFNGASNAGVTGRARSGEQRNILSYGRGKLDESRTEDGTRMRVLRGDGEDTWTAVAMTWLDHDGSRFTALRAWYIPASARGVDDTVKIRGTVDGPFELTRLEEAAAHRLGAAAIREAGVETQPTDREFLARIYSVLGIGAAGSGTKAMSLLARIQAGQQITTVDELYKRMVLEEPATLATADAVVSHFDELQATRDRMITAQKQVHALSPIRTMRARIDAAARRLELLDAVGDFSQPDSRAGRWRAEYRLSLLRAAEEELRRRKSTADAQVAASAATASAAEAEYEAAREVLRSSGGARLETAERELRQTERRLEEVRAAHRAFAEATACLGTQITGRKDFEDLRERAQAALADSDTRRSARTDHGRAYAEAQALRRRLEGLRTEQDQARSRQDSIPAGLHTAREQLARAAGLHIQQLPFVGELVEVRAEYEPWREAFNLALGGFATTLLIDATQLGRLRGAINELRLSTRLRYEGVRTGVQHRGRLDPDSLPGRLEYRDTEFTGWLKERLEQRFAFVCVDSPDQLASHARALTITGQMSQGNRGAHGGHGRSNVLGFSSRRRLAELAQEEERLAADLTRAEAARERAERALDDVEAHRAAYRRVLDTGWEQIDVRALEQEQARWGGVVAEASTDNPEVTSLRRKVDELGRKVQEFQQQVGRARADQEALAERWAVTSDAVDEAQGLLDEAQENGEVLTDDEREYLSGRFAPTPAAAELDPLRRLEHFDTALAAGARLLKEDRANARTTLDEQRAALRHALESFLDAWPNPGLRADPETSYRDFERILTDLETSGLHELEEQWRNSLLRLSGNDLANLDSALARALREVRERIEPVNRIMADLPFYDDAHRLQINLRENQSRVRSRFRRDLREVRALIEAADTEARRAQAYVRMSRLIDRIRRSAPDFSTLVDVRNHVRISAEKVHAATGAHAALYDHIGEKSGGESQELIAFIVGAALRYQLGDAAAERPRYAVVFLDEALIKADAHFTKRAIGAWRGLGFQLVIGAPNDKYSAIEPHVDVEYDILKDTKGRSWEKLKIGLDEVVA